MKRLSKTLSGIAKNKVSRSNGRVVASSQWYSTIPPPKVDQDLEEEEEEEDDEGEGSLKKEEDEAEGWLKKMEFIPFPEGYIGGGGFLVKKKEETDKSTGTKSSSANGTDMNYNYGTNGGKSYDKRTTSNSDDGQGTEIPEYGGCSGCPGCVRCGCPGCSGGCRYCFGCDGCQYKF